MKRTIQISVIALLAIIGTSFGFLTKTTEEPSLRDQYSDITSKIIVRALQDSNAHQRLSIMCDTYGPRLSGSKNLEQAIDWIVATMKKDGFDTVYTEPVKVPHWVRGNESLTLNSM